MTYDPSVVLTYISTLLSNSQLLSVSLSKKLATLVCLLSGQQVQSDNKLITFVSLKTTYQKPLRLINQESIWHHKHLKNSCQMKKIVLWRALKNIFNEQNASEKNKKTNQHNCCYHFHHSTTQLVLKLVHDMLSCFSIRQK